MNNKNPATAHLNKIKKYLEQYAKTLDKARAAMQTNPKYANASHAMPGNLQELPAQQKQQLAVSYLEMYFGLTKTMWARGKTLGASWQSAMEQMDAMLKGKEGNNPSVAYLHEIHLAHKKYWSGNIMKNPNRDKKLHLTQEKKAEWIQKSETQVNTAMWTLNTTIGNYANKTPQTKTKTPEPFVNAQQKIQMIAMMKMRMRQYTNEHAA